MVLDYRQEYGEHYEETFALIAKMTTVRALLAMAAQQSRSKYK